MRQPPRRLFIALLGLILLLSSLVFGGYQLMNARTYQAFGALVHRVETDTRVVALTFDDGPTSMTDPVIQILNDAGINATFFLNGREMEAHPEETRRIVRAGHQIGNHTWSHPRMVLRPPGFIREEIEATDTRIRAAGYAGDIHFRPPYGKKLFLLPYYLHTNNRTTIMWDVEPESYPETAQDPDALIDHVAANTRPGSIILLHVMHGHTAHPSYTALPGLIAALHEQGYRFVTVSELLNYRN